MPITVHEYGAAGLHVDRVPEHREQDQAERPPGDGQVREPDERADERDRARRRRRARCEIVKNSKMISASPTTSRKYAIDGLVSVCTAWPTRSSLRKRMSWSGWRRRSWPLPTTFAVSTLHRAGRGVDASCRRASTTKSPSVAQPGGAGHTRASVTPFATAASLPSDRCRIARARTRVRPLRTARRRRGHAAPRRSGPSSRTGSIGPMLEPFGHRDDRRLQTRPAAASPRAFDPDGPTQDTTGTRDRSIARSTRSGSTSTAPPESSVITRICDVVAVRGVHRVDG